MRPLSEYDALIFDCDGVILDSNTLKIDAMENALRSSGYCSDVQLQECVDFFASNFGISRFKHVTHFVDSVLDVEAGKRQVCYDTILELYSSQCYELYLKSEITPGFIDLMNRVSVPCYVASGSVEDELVSVFQARGLSQYFSGIYGSPTPKTEIVRKICDAYPFGNLLMVGDAESDYGAAKNSDIDFLFYSPYSNVKKKMLSLSGECGFSVCDDFAELK